MIERDILNWVKADEAAESLRQAALWFISRDPMKAKLLAREAAKARAEAMDARDSIIDNAGKQDRPSRSAPEKPSS